MWKKMMLSAAALAVSVSFAACSSFETASNRNDQRLTVQENVESIAHINGEIWGVYLLGTIPLFSGSNITPGRCAMFSDTVTVPSVVGMVTKSAKSRLNSTAVIDMASEKTSSWMMPTILLWYKSIQVSGNAVR